MRARGIRRGVIFSVLAVLVIFTSRGETAGRTKRRRCMAVKNEWRAKGFGDNQQVPSSPVSGITQSMLLLIVGVAVLCFVHPMCGGGGFTKLTKSSTLVF